MAERIASAGLAQAAWSALPVRARLLPLRRFRALVAREGARLAHAAGAARGRSQAEKLTSEVIPLAAAVRFLEENAPRLLRPRRLGRRGRPVWLARVATEICREPFGTVLIVGPANYPLFLPGVQALQALAAGNAVLLKPGRGGSAAAEAIARLLHEAELPPHLLQVLPEAPAEVYAALAAGVQLVVFTGSTEAGRAVLRAAAEAAVPVIAELSGDDPVLVRADADLALVERAVRFGAELNGGDSCIAPRRLYAPPHAVERLAEQLPEVSVRPVPGDDGAVAAASSSPYALGATIFSRDERAARALAHRIPAGMVVINDCIVPSADPRLPFGGRGASGYGVTRGAEGLLALTRLRVICLQRGRRFHLEPAQAADAEFFLAYLQAAHGGARASRWRAWWRLLRLAAARAKAS